MLEIWKDIKGYEGVYQVSNLGRVKSLSRTVGNRHKRNIKTLKENRIMKPCIKDNGYLYVSLTKDRKRNNKYIHRLVAEAFIPQIDGKNVVNHKDYNRSNNKVDNLEWLTQKENTLYSVERMRKPHNSRASITGYKYVYKRKNKFRLAIKNIIDRRFDSLDDALRVREVIMNGEQYFAS